MEISTHLGLDVHKDTIAVAILRAGELAADQRVIENTPEALRKLVGAIRKNNTAFILTNQLRHNNRVVFCAPETPTGGMALRFYAAVRIDLRRLKVVKLKGEIIGSHIRATVKKNKVAAPLRVADFTLYHY